MNGYGTEKAAGRAFNYLRFSRALIFIIVAFVADSASAQFLTPSLTSVSALSKQRLLATYSSAPGSSSAARDPRNYSITGPNNTTLAVIAIAPIGTTRDAIITTAPQQAVSYTMRFPRSSLRPSARTFAGSTIAEPTLQNAIALDNTHVLLVFSDPVGQSATDKAFYRIAAKSNSSATLGVTAAAIDPQNPKNVILTTAPQIAMAYIVRVGDIKNQAGILLDPTKNTAEFTGIGAIDNIPPKLVSAIPQGETSVLLSFSEPIDPTAAANIANYVSAPDIFIQSLLLLNQNTQALLTTGVLYAVSYKLTISSIADARGNVIAPPNNTVTFMGSRPFNTTDRPRLANAASTGNTKVVIQFSKPMGDSAQNPSRYVITQENVNSEVGTVPITGAQFMNGDRMSVELTTRSQNEVTYRVAVSNVTDLAGLPLAEKQIVNGVITIDPTSFTFPGTPPAASERVDSDGDGLFDNEEFVGYVVTIRLANGETVKRQVTADPNSADADNDGLGDFTEKSLGTDPRDNDTDDDGLGDQDEFNEIFSDPTVQDSDGDTLTDGLEVNFFRTSAILSDTDGDQIPDGVEITLAKRNPRVGDLPMPALEIGQTSMQLDVRFLEFRGNETRQVDSRTVASTLVQTESQEFSRSESRTIEVGTKASQTIGASFGFSAGMGAGYAQQISVSSTTEQSFNSSFTSSWSETSRRETQESYEDSLTTSAETSDSSNVTREIMGARMQVTVFLQTPGNIAFTIKNIQVTALIQDPLDPGRLTPVATLLPDLEPAAGFSLGPLAPSRGPIIFSNNQVFPQQIEDLMRNPRGLVFRFSNYDITDELGRNFAFTSQDINDRTAALVIDFGGFDSDLDGRGDFSEINRVATGIGQRLDTNGDGAIDEEDRFVVFDANGRQIGITLRGALQAVGLAEFNEDETPTASLTSTQRQNSYSVREDDLGAEQIYRIRRTVITSESLMRWDIFTPTGINRNLGLDDFILQPGETYTLAFLKDEDNDNLPALLEFINNCSDRLKDTDSDTLDDRFEVLVGWRVTTERGSKPVRSRCSSADTDRDGLSDGDEAPGLITRDSDGLILFDDGISLINPMNFPRPNTALDTTSLRVSPDDTQAFLLTIADPITNPASADTDLDGLFDGFEIAGYTVNLFGRGADGIDGNTDDTVFRKTSPEFFDSDDDTASDGVEFRLGGDPRILDLNNFGDSDGDGLVNIQETQGWMITVRGVSASPALCDGGGAGCNEGAAVMFTVASDPFKRDTDGDGLSDLEEFNFGTNPTIFRDSGGNIIAGRDGRDTDTDGIPDAQEALGFTLRNLGIIRTDVTDADTDNDKRSDGAEAGRFTNQRIIVRVPGQAPYEAFSNPLDSDSDLDQLVDGDEAAVGADPNNFNTDGDTRSDYNEVFLGGRRPTVPDLRVTVNFVGIFVAEDCEEGDNAGDWTFNFDLRRPNGQLVSVVNNVNALDFFTTLEDVPSCDGDEDEEVCRRNGGNVIQIERQTTLLFSRYGNKDRNVSVGSVSTSRDLLEQFSIEGRMTEFEGSTIDGGPFIFPNTTSTTAGGDMTGLVTGTELRPGTSSLSVQQTGTSLIQEEACDITFLGSYTAD